MTGLGLQWQKNENSLFIMLPTYNADLIFFGKFYIFTQCQYLNSAWLLYLLKDVHRFTPNTVCDASQTDRPMSSCLHSRPIQKTNSRKFDICPIFAVCCSDSSAFYRFLTRKKRDYRNRPSFLGLMAVTPCRQEKHSGCSLFSQFSGCHFTVRHESELFSEFVWAAVSRKVVYANSNSSSTIFFDLHVCQTNGFLPRCTVWLDSSNGPSPLPSGKPPNGSFM